MSKRKTKGPNGKDREARLFQLAIIAGILQLINNLIELVLKFSKD